MNTSNDIQLYNKNLQLFQEKYSTLNNEANEMETAINNNKESILKLRDLFSSNYKTII